ncbi:hypothetical protein BH23CHL2_BH23CHL2_13910 [soil metagenome]
MTESLIVERREYPLGGVKTAEVELEVRAGSLAVTGGATELCSADFAYSHVELRPVDDYEQDDNEAELGISQPRTNDLEDTYSSWQLAVNSDVQIELAISILSGNATLDLDHVQVSSVEVDSRSGSVEASLAGSYPALDEIVIDSVSGRSALELSGEFAELTTIEIDSKSGPIELAVTGTCPELKRIAVDSKSGPVSIDLRGSFQRDDLGVRVDSISGNVQIRVQKDVGVSMNANTISGRVQAADFGGETGRLTNAAFGRSPATIWLNVHVTSGNIEVVSD